MAQTSPPNLVGREGRQPVPHGLTSGQAMGALMRIKPEDVKKINAATDANKGKRRKGK